jgi:phosphonate transport system substrate-binding protein
MLRILGLWLILLTANAQAVEPLQFGVLNQRSVLLTAQLWNPILRYVTAKTGVPLVLRMGKTADETLAMTLHNEFDFVYSNHLFTPERDQLGYRAIARFNGGDIAGMLVVATASPYRKLTDLDGKEVAFTNPNAFAAYVLVMDELVKAGVRVHPRFIGNQEAALSSAQYGHSAAAGVNNIILNSYMQREKADFRVLYTSPYYADIPVMAHPRVPASTVAAVQRALVNMDQDAEGLRVLSAAQGLLQQPTPVSFVSASDRDYDNYRLFYQRQIQSANK